MVVTQFEPAYLFWNDGRLEKIDVETGAIVIIRPVLSLEARLRLHAPGAVSADTPCAVDNHRFVRTSMAFHGRIAYVQEHYTEALELLLALDRRDRTQ